MHRIVDRRYSEAIGYSLSVFPSGLRHWVEGVDFLTDTCPNFAGLHTYREATYDRVYSSTAHAVYPYHQEHRPRSERRMTVVLPKVEHPDVIIHELAHMLDYQLGFIQGVGPVTWYAEEQERECFAEAVTSWLIPGYAKRPDDKTISLLEALTHGC